MDSFEDRQDSLSQEPMTPHPQAKPPRSNRVAIVISVLAALPVIGLIAQLLLGLAQPAPSGIASSATVTAPVTATATTQAAPIPTSTISPFALEDGLSFTSDRPSYPQYPTPQAAFTAAAVIYLCGTGETRSHTVTWLTSGLEQGLVLIQGRCADGRLPFIIGQIQRAADHCRDWDVQMAVFAQDRPKNISADNQAEVPSWLPLPHDTYAPENSAAGDHPPFFSSKTWVSPKHIYSASRYQAPAPRPAKATTVTVNGTAGWSVSQDGMTVITVPLSGNQAFSFAGNGSVADVLPLAQATLANLGTVLPKLPTQPARVCP